MSHRHRLPLLAFLVVAFVAPLSSQALPNLTSLAVSYNTQKNKAKPQGDLKARIAALDTEIAEAERLGRTGELRRLYAKGTTLLGGRAWTDELDFARSLVLRADRLIVDSSKPWTTRLEQIYTSTIALEKPLAARAFLRLPPAAASRGAGAGGGAADGPVKDFGSVDGVSRDLHESPLVFHLDLAGVPDGSYQLVVEVRDGERILGTAVRPLLASRGLDAIVARLEQAAANAPADLRPEILYPIDRMRVINQGGLPFGQFNPLRDLADANAAATAAAAGQNPFEARTGDFKRHYLLESAGEILPYRIHVPATYSTSRTWPLVVALHGLGGNEDSLFDSYRGTLQKLSEDHGVIVVAPSGYRPDGFYGVRRYINLQDPSAVRRVERSEDAVLQTLAHVRRQYAVDASRIYLMGHSMGAIGTWWLAPKYPEIWAALGPVAGIGDPALLERIRHIPQFVVHGDADTTVPVEHSRTMVARMKELGINYTYVEVPAGDHVNIAIPNLAAMFEFFMKHRSR